MIKGDLVLVLFMIEYTQLRLILKKRFYKKRLVEILSHKKRRLVDFSALRNKFLRITVQNQFAKKQL